MVGRDDATTCVFAGAIAQLAQPSVISRSPVAPATVSTTRPLGPDAAKPKSSMKQLRLISGRLSTNKSSFLRRYTLNRAVANEQPATTPREAKRGAAVYAPYRRYLPHQYTASATRRRCKHQGRLALVYKR